MRSFLLFITLVLLHIGGLYALAEAIDSRGTADPAYSAEHPKKAARTLANQIPGPEDAPDQNIGQGERMLRDVRDPNPGFMKPPPPHSYWEGVCRTDIGAYYDSYWDPRGYERCMDQPDRAMGAGMLIPVH